MDMISVLTSEKIQKLPLKIQISTISFQKVKLTLFFFPSPVPFSAPEFSLSSTLKLTLEVFFRPSLFVVAVSLPCDDEVDDFVSVDMEAGAIVNGGTQSELNTISASL